MKLSYDENRWQQRVSDPHNTLQIFITNRCNKRCKACFYDERLGKEDMEWEYYRDLVDQYQDKVKKVILIGGEPTMHPDVRRMIEYNILSGLKTTIYTNGTNVDVLGNYREDKVSIRVGVLGLTGTEKNLAEVKSQVPFMTVLMLRPDNVWQLPYVAQYAQDYTNSQGIMISSIRDLVKTQSFWEDTPDTLSNQEFAETVNKFVKEYKGNLPTIHVCRRTTVDGPTHYDKCRYINVYPNGEKTICPLDISLGITDGEGYELSTRKCQKHHECILQKTVLEKK
jgi:sulfatase maturation enzyme AslB (radical SAM superfamily)